MLRTYYLANLQLSKVLAYHTTEACDLNLLFVLSWSRLVVVDMRVLAGQECSKLYIFEISWTSFDCHHSFDLQVNQKELQLFHHTHQVPKCINLAKILHKFSLVGP